MTERPTDQPAPGEQGEPDDRVGHPGHDAEDEQEAYDLERQEDIERQEGEGQAPEYDR